MPTTVTRTIRSSGGDYTTLSAWEAGEQKNLVTADEIAVAECYDDWSTGLLNPTTISGWTTDATRYVHVLAAAGHEHGGIPGAGFWLRSNSGFTRALSVSQAHTRLTDIEVVNQSTGGDTDAITVTAGSCRLKRVLAKNSRSGSAAFVFDSGSAGTQVDTSLAYGSTGNGFSAINFGSFTALNCGAVNCATGFLRNGTNSTFVAKNCVAYNNTTNYSGTFDGASTHNATSSGSDDAPGGSSVTGIDSTDFVDAAGNDFHLASGSALIGVGTNLYSDLTTDIDGDTWPSSGAWDIGFDYLVAGGGGTEYTFTVSGGMQFSGTVTQNFERSFVSTGGIAFAGTEALRREHVTQISGGFNLAGTNTPLHERQIVTSGGTTFSGTSPLTENAAFQFTPSGGVSFGAGSTFIRQRTFVPSGGVTFAGTARVFFTAVGTVVNRVINKISIGISRLMGLS